MNKKKIIVSTLIGSLFLSLSAFALSVAQRPGIKELETNKEYMELMRRSDRLTLRADSINGMLAECRMLMIEATENDNIDSLRSVIISLEQRGHDISVELGNVTRRIGAIEQDYIMDQIISNQQHVVIGETIDDSVSENTNAVANLVDNDCFRLNLTDDDYEDLLLAQREESEMLQLTARYLEAYEELRQVAEEYPKADRASVAEPLYAKYTQLCKELDDINESMTQKWNHILDAKYFAMAYILEKSHRYDIIDRASNNYQQMQYNCASNDGVYSSDALMRYALGRRTLLTYEHEFARDMRLKPAQDSLQGVIRGYKEPMFTLRPITIEKIIFMDLSKVKLARTNFYDETSNPLPELRVFDSGTIYRILLGKYRSKQTMTLFKGVQPMSYERNADGMYCYYAGGYATEEEAREDMQFLEGKGFKSLELCRWEDGVYSVISKPKTAPKKTTTTTTKAVTTTQTSPTVQYMVVIRADEMNDRMRSLIKSAAPGKSMSRNGNTFIISLFKSRGEADTLLTTLTDSFPMLEMTIKEIKVE